MTNRNTTHFHGCWHTDGHQLCAIAEIDRLRKKLEDVRNHEQQNIELKARILSAWKQGWLTTPAAAILLDVRPNVLQHMAEQLGYGETE